MIRKFLAFSAVAASLMFVSCGTTQDFASTEDPAKVKRTAYSGVTNREVIGVRTTAYTHSESDHLIYGRKNAIGTDLRYYSGVRSAAADWSRYPLGTRFQIVGSPIVYEIDDYGSALVGKNTIDLYKPSRAHMNAWGARNVQVRILKWGSYRESMHVLKDRTKYQHVQQMVRGISRKIG